MRIPHPYERQHAVELVGRLPELWATRDDLMLAIADRTDGTFYGAVGLKLELDQRRAETGYWVGTPYWGRGLATEAARALLAWGFEQLDLVRIQAHAMTSNPGSSRVLAKLGMRREGLLRSYFYKWDQAVDAELWAILHDDPR